MDEESLRRWMLEPVNPDSDHRIRTLRSITNVEGKRCLDIGFGNGFLLRSLKQLGASPFGIDLDIQAVDLASRYFAGVPVKRCTIFELPAEEMFDVIVMADIIEHPIFPYEMLVKASSLLKRNGLMLMVTPNSTYAGEEEAPVLFRVDLEHMQYFSFRTCNYVSKALGLDIVHLESWGFPGVRNTENASSTNSVATRLYRKARHSIKRGRWYQALSYIRESIVRNRYRMGRYHLFCIFQKLF